MEFIFYSSKILDRNFDFFPLGLSFWVAHMISIKMARLAKEKRTVSIGGRRRQIPRVEASKDKSYVWA